MSWPVEPCEWCPRTAAGLAGDCLCQTKRLRGICEQFRDGNRQHAGLVLGQVELAKTAPAYGSEVMGRYGMGRRSRMDGVGHAIRPPLSPYLYVTTERLAADSRVLISHLPPDIDLVAAISRSGLLPGSLAAYHLNTPLVTVNRSTGVLEPGSGRRMGGKATTAPRHVLLIDDTAAWGQEMRDCAPIVRNAYPAVKVTRAVVYVSTGAARAVDLYVAELPGAHYLEWNWANSGHAERIAFDFDGILCRDFTGAECSTPESYRTAMATITPLHLPRRRPVPLIVTGRPESTRAITLDWLARHRVDVKRLVMWPGDAGPGGPAWQEAAKWKAGHFKASSCDLFAESDPRQAEAIAEASGKSVLCPIAGKVYPGKPRYVPFTADEMTAINACPHRECRTGCQLSLCRAGKGDRWGQTTLENCRACLANLSRGSRPTSKFDTTGASL